MESGNSAKSQERKQEIEAGVLNLLDDDAKSTTDAYQYFKVVKAVFLEVTLVIFHFTGLFGNVLLHRNFGQRYVTLPKVIIASLLLLTPLLFMFAINIVVVKLATPEFLQENRFLLAKSIFGVIVYLSLFVLFVFKSLMILIENRTNENRELHSYYIGDSYPLWKLLPFLRPVYNSGYYQYLLESIVVLLLGIVSGVLVSASVGLLLLITGISLFMIHYLSSVKMKNRILDHMDQRLENQVFTEAIHYWHTADSIETNGVNIPPVFNRLPKAEKKTVAEMVAELDPELQRLYEESFQESEDSEDDDEETLASGEQEPTEYDYEHQEESTDKPSAIDDDRRD